MWPEGLDRDSGAITSSDQVITKGEPIMGCKEKEAAQKVYNSARGFLGRALVQGCNNSQIVDMETNMVARSTNGSPTGQKQPSLEPFP
jgi:hypothetical protein